ncbi:kinase-like domain-containing protein [Staphylotrichum tortipilum]|uniref:Kinase-like domain-containing protein n=1 Tax=Staphylotrichum tortipilum TaxID=2831512 RepID=A0AAN6RNR0_9PEZI|nr:kinase-like domain-containing protein [Staphylotrichum longicolle]
MEPANAYPKTYKLLDRVFIVEKDKYIKRELTEDEYFRRPNGQVIHPYWVRERIQNEADAITFIRANTDIPVPKCRLYRQGGLLHLETTRIPGIMLDDVAQDKKPTAIDAVTEQINGNILPQLRRLHRRTIGFLDCALPVIPPPRIYRRDRRSWERVIAPETRPFVFCHNDLNNRNILVDPTTFRITGIIDWEFAGYFPSEWELALWPLDWEGGRLLNEQVERRDLALFGLEPEDLRDCLEERP